MVELRKRKPAQEPAAPPPSKKTSSNPIKSAVEKAKAAVGGNKPNGTTASKVTVGETISLDGFGGEIETNEGATTSLKKLVDESTNGVVLFTYPKASTPGCTTQACLFRDAYTHLTSTGLSIFGLSTDSPKANTTFKTKQSLPYPLLCDPSGNLISAIGLKKAPKGTTRGVFVVDKSGKVLAAEPGGPQATVDVVANLIKEGKVGGGLTTAEAVKTAAEEAPTSAKEDIAPAAAGTDEEPPKMEEPPLEHEVSKEDAEAANTAADVADSAAKLDGDAVKSTE